MIYEKIKQYCKKNGLSISAFEKKCNIGNGTVGRWENDDSKPSLQTLEKIVRTTGIPMQDWIA